MNKHDKEILIAKIQGMMMGALYALGGLFIIINILE